jgi:hypothetical protein
MAGFGISGVEPLGSATTVLVSKMDLQGDRLRMGGRLNWLRIESDGRFWY